MRTKTTDATRTHRWGRPRVCDRFGDSLPPAPARRQPFIGAMAEDHEVRIANSGDRADVVVLVSHERWPGVRFGHRFPPPEESDGYEAISLMEEVETGGLRRLMDRRPDPDDDGIIWTDGG
jgi:hypothetical protein